MSNAYLPHPALSPPVVSVLIIFLSLGKMKTRGRTCFCVSSLLNLDRNKGSGASITISILIVDKLRGSVGGKSY